MARNLEALLPLVAEYGPGRIAFCTDDRDPEDIADNGHVNGMVRDAVAFGIEPADAILMASLHPGPVAPAVAGTARRARATSADLLVLARPRALRARARAEARPADRGPAARRGARVGAPDASASSPSPRRDFAIPWEGGAARAIGLIEDQVVTESLERRAARRRRARGVGPRARPREDRGRRASPRDRAGRSRLRLRLRAPARRARVDRRPRRAQPRRGRRGRRGHGVRGRRDSPSSAAASSPSTAGRVVAECPLPVAGLLSDQPLEVVVAQSRACNEAAAGLGWSGATPFLTLAFLALSVIPSLKLTDRGLVDVDRFEIVPLAAGEPARLSRS